MSGKARISAASPETPTIGIRGSRVGHCGAVLAIFQGSSTGHLSEEQRGLHFKGIVCDGGVKDSDQVTLILSH